MLLHSGKTTVTHIHGCVVTTVYPTLPRFKSKMALVWDRSIDSGRHTSTVGNLKIALSERIALLLHPHVDIPFSLVVK